MAIFRRIANLFSRPALDREIADELASHIEMRIEDNLAQGMSPEAARRDALLRFGNPVSTGERVVAADAALLLEYLWSDVRYGLRQLRKSPAFAATTVLTLAVGIGINLAVFHLLYGLLLSQLPIHEPAQIQTIRSAPTPFDGGYYLSYPAYRRLRQSTQDSAPVIAHTWFGGGVLQDASGTSSHVGFQLVSDNFFRVLGVSPLAGRFFSDGDDEKQPAEWPVVLQYRYFRTHYGNVKAALGTRATYDGIPIVIVGIAPAGFNGMSKGFAPDLWLPLAAQATGKFQTAFDSLGPGYDVHLEKPYQDQPTIFWLAVLARVPEQAKSQSLAHWTSTLAPDLSMIASVTKDKQARDAILATSVRLVPAANGEGSMAKYYTTPLTVLMTMAFVILLAGCLNLANLQMARLQQRQVEIATRIALGASRARILTQVLVEALLLAAIGGALAFATARGCTAILLSWASGRDNVMPIDTSIDMHTLLLGAVLLLASMIGFALIPAWMMTRKNFSAAATARIGQVSGLTRTGRRWSSLLLAVQVSISLLLLCVTALFAQTLRNLDRQDTGFDRDHILTVHLDMRSTGFGKAQTNLPAFYRALIERLDGLPAVSSAAVHMCTIPDCGWNTAVYAFGMPNASDNASHGEEDHVGAGYFETMSIPLLAGRTFTEDDIEHTRKVAIVSQSYARRLFGNESPIGHWVGYNAAPADHDFQIVGEVQDARVDGPRDNPPPMFYRPIAPDTTLQAVEVRASGSLEMLPGAIRQALHEAAPGLPVTEIVPLNIELYDRLSTETLLSRLTAVFGALTLALAAIGFYGLLSFRVSMRMPEIGVRMALGDARTLSSRDAVDSSLRHDSRNSAGCSCGVHGQKTALWFRKHEPGGHRSSHAHPAYGRSSGYAPAGTPRCVGRSGARSADGVDRNEGLSVPASSTAAASAGPRK